MAISIKNHLVDPESDLGRNLEPDLHHAINARLNTADKDALTLTDSSIVWIDLGRRESGHEQELFAQMGARGAPHDPRRLVMECGFDAVGRMRVLLGKRSDTKHENNTHTIANLTTMIWDSDTGLDGEGAEVHEKVREAIAYRLSNLDENLRGATHCLRNNDSFGSLEYFDEAPRRATLVMDLMLPKNLPEKPDYSKGVL